MKTQNSVSQTIRILHEINKKRYFKQKCQASENYVHFYGLNTWLGLLLHELLHQCGMAWRQSAIMRKAQQRLYFLRQLRKFNLPQELLKQFYSAITESVLCTSITVWFSSATKSDLRRLQRVVWTAEGIISTTLPSLQ